MLLLPGEGSQEKRVRLLHKKISCHILNDRIIVWEFTQSQTDRSLFKHINHGLQSRKCIFCQKEIRLHDFSCTTQTAAGHIVFNI